MKYAKTILTSLLLLAATITEAASPYADTNAVWMTRYNVTTSGLINRIPVLAEQLRDHGIKYIFLNSATLNSDGVAKQSPAYLTEFLNELKLWEDANNYEFEVLIWVTGSTASIDLKDEKIREAIAKESQKLMSERGRDSYIANSKRTPDGMLLELQPLGGHIDEAIDLLNEIRQENRSGQEIGLATQRVGASSDWELSPEDYNELAQHADILVGLNFNSGSISPAAYEQWVAAQTTDTLKAISGEYWKNSSRFKAPRHQVKVFISFPAFPQIENRHDPHAENISSAAAGVSKALESLDYDSRKYFEGAAIYALNDGAADSNYADWNSDWVSFQNTWINQ